jgi:hypothetical protein
MVVYSRLWSIQIDRSHSSVVVRREVLGKVVGEVITGTLRFFLSLQLRRYANLDPATKGQKAPKSCAPGDGLSIPLHFKCFDYHINTYSGREMRAADESLRLVVRLVDWSDLECDTLAQTHAHQVRMY